MYVEQFLKRVKAHFSGCEINQWCLIKAAMDCWLFTKRECRIRHKKKSSSMLTFMAARCSQPRWCSCREEAFKTTLHTSGRQQSCRQQSSSSFCLSPMVWRGLLLWPFTQHSQPPVLHTVGGWGASLHILCNIFWIIWKTNPDIFKN